MKERGRERKERLNGCTPYEREKGILYDTVGEHGKEARGEKAKGVGTIELKFEGDFR